MFWVSNIVQLVPVCSFVGWMAASSTDGNPGMEGHFYFQFCFLYFFAVLVGSVGLWSARKASDSHQGSKVSSTGNHGNSSSDKEKSTTEIRHSSFSYTMDELNGQARPKETV